MGKIIMPGGGNVIYSEDCTATANDILKGKTALFNGSDDDIGMGTLELTGNANASHVLKGKTFYSTNAHTKSTGIIESMAGNTPIPSTSQQVIPVAGKYMTSNIIIPGFTMPPASVIKKGTTINVYNQSVTGTYNGYGIYEQNHFWNSGTNYCVEGAGQLGFGDMGQIWSEANTTGDNYLTTTIEIDLRRYNTIYVNIAKSAFFQNGRVSIYRIRSGVMTFICSFNTTSNTYGFQRYKYDLSLPGQLRLVFDQQGTGILTWGVENNV